MKRKGFYVEEGKSKNAAFQVSQEARIKKQEAHHFYTLK